MPDPTTFIYKLACAIATAEGYFVPNSVPARNHNPGDERGAPWLTNPTIVGGFVKFDSDGLGIAGLFHQIALNIARGYSLRKLVYTWAPPADGNNSANYLNETGRRIGLDAIHFDTPLYEFLSVNLIP